MDSVKAPTFQKGAIKSSSLVLLVLATALFPRIVTAVGAPAVINFLHFAFVTVVFGLNFPKLRKRLSANLLIGIIALLGLIIISAFVNDAGFINIVLDFLLLAEPFLLLLAMISVRWFRASIIQFRFYLLLFAFVHVILAYFQSFILRYSNPDDVEGVFINMGAGSHLAGAVALSTAVYLFMVPEIRSIWTRAFLTVACAGVVIVSDAKQVIVVFFISLLIILINNLSKFGKFLRYFLIALTVPGILIWAANTVFPALKHWANIDKLSEGFSQKFLVFSIIRSYYNTPLNWLFGLGPGHTIGRLGWLMPDYMEYLKPLGVTTYSQIFEQVSAVQEGHWMTNSITGSSMFSLLFSWAGVWGDLGFFGLGVYLYIWFLVWYHLCLDDISRFFLITILVFGLVFSWMEEPGYMLFVVSLIGSRWQVHQYKHEQN